MLDSLKEFLLKNHFDLEDERYMLDEERVEEICAAIKITYDEDRIAKITFTKKFLISPLYNELEFFVYERINDTLCTWKHRFVC